MIRFSSLLAVALAVAAQFSLAASTAPEIAQQIRSASLDPAECYRVRDLSLAAEDLKLYFTNGYLIFSKPVAGERLSAVFSAGTEGGDGEVLLLPPYRSERASLARFTPSPNLDEHLHAAVLVFSDGSAKTLLDQIAAGGGQKETSLGPLLAEQWTPALSSIESGFELRLVADLLTESSQRSGFLVAELSGKRLGNFEALYDTWPQPQITLGRPAQRDGRTVYDVWTSFPARNVRAAAARPSVPAPARISEQSYTIDATLDENLALTAKVRAEVRTGAETQRVIAFAAARAVAVTSARVDDQPAKLLFSDPFPGNATGDADNVTFLVIPARELPPNTSHHVDFEEHGNVISPAGNNVYFVAARANWYPRAGTALATYDLTFRYPNRLTLVTAGEIKEDRVDGDFRVTRRTTPVPIRLAGFNLGDYVKAEGLASAAQATGVHVEVYGNRRVEAALMPKATLPEAQPRPEPQPSPRYPRRGMPKQPSAPVGPPPPPNPLARLQSVAADISSAVQFYTGLFGPPSLRNLTVAPIPGNFGQGFPGLVYLSTLAYLDPSQRPEADRGLQAQVFFSDLIEPHEVAHQWWGNIVMPASYQDEWLSEAVATYSSLLYLEKKKGTQAMEDVLEDFRDSLVKKDGKGGTVESAGPITWGFRLDSSAGSAAARDEITYEKGAWVLHMLRRRIGDTRFLKLLSEMRQRFDSRTISTEQFAGLVKEFAPPRAPGSPAFSPPFSVDAFFDNWVYSSGIPTLKLDYTVKGIAPAVRLSGTVQQSGVEDDFSIAAPVEVQFAKGAPRIIWVETSNDGATFSATLPQAPVKVSIPAGREVLAVRK